MVVLSCTLIFGFLSKALLESLHDLGLKKRFIIKTDASHQVGSVGHWLLSQGRVVQKAKQHFLQLSLGLDQVASVFEHLSLSIQLYLPPSDKLALENMFSTGPQEGKK